MPHHQRPAPLVNQRLGPRPGNDFRPDPGRVAHGDGNQRLECFGCIGWGPRKDCTRPPLGRQSQLRQDQGLMKIAAEAVRDIDRGRLQPAGCGEVWRRTPRVRSCRKRYLVFMRACIQRVSRAAVAVARRSAAASDPACWSCWASPAATPRPTPQKLAEKIGGLRIFEDGEGKMNRSLAEVGGAMLIVSQFTLLGDCRHGRRPDFTAAAPPDVAETALPRLRARGGRPRRHSGHRPLPPAHGGRIGQRRPRHAHRRELKKPQPSVGFAQRWKTLSIHAAVVARTPDSAPGDCDQDHCGCRTSTAESTASAA